MKVFAVVVTFNGMDWIVKCFDSLIASTTPVSIVVVDNASTDGTAEFIIENYPVVDVIRSEENLGFAKANNIGLRYAYDHGADWFFLLNQDAWIEKDVISNLLSAFSAANNIGIASPIHLNGAGNGMDRLFASYMPSDFVSDAYLNKINDIYDVRFVNAACWMLSRACIEKIGGFDTSIFVHYGEDVNYCQRVRFHGFRIVVSTFCQAYHDRAQRSSCEDEYRNRVFRVPDLPRRIDMGDININYDISELIDRQKNLRWRKALTFRFKSIRKHTEEIKFLTSIGKSRDINAQCGLNWL